MVWSLQRLPLTRALKVFFFLRFKPAVWWTSFNYYHGFHAWTKRRFFPRFSSTRRKMSTFKSFLQYFATGPDTASCQDYEGYEFVECLLEETQMIVLFTSCKLQPHKLSQYTLAPHHHHHHHHHQLELVYTLLGRWKAPSTGKQERTWQVRLHQSGQSRGRVHFAFPGCFKLWCKNSQNVF